MSTHNICFYGEITKSVPKLSSDTLLICSTEFILFAQLSLNYGKGLFVRADRDLRKNM